MAFLVPATLRGDTCRVSLTFVVSSFAFVPLGIAIGFLCYLIGGSQWRPWIVSLGVGFGSFLAVLWGTAAELIQQPRTLIVGSPVALILLLLTPALAFKQDDNVRLLLDTACLTAAVVVGCLMSLALSHLPFGVGAEPATRHVPARAARNAAALADMFEAVAIWQTPSTAALLRHRECRLRLLTASHGFRSACSSSAFELRPGLGAWENWESFADAAENCRLALQLKSGMLSLGFSPVAIKLWYQGHVGEAMRRSCFSAAAALRSSASRLASLAGAPPPAEVPSAPWLTSDHTTANDCQEAATLCRHAMDSYLDFWQRTYLNHTDTRWRQHLEEVMLKEMTSFETLDETPMQMYLSGRHHLKEDNAESWQLDAARLAGFDEASRLSACLVGVCNAAEAAAQMAELVAEGKEKEPRGQMRFSCHVGLRAWLQVPLSCRRWPAAFAKAKSFGFRVSVALITISLIFALVEPNAVWPSEQGPLWTLLTTALIITPVQGASLLRGLRRMAGTCIGSGLALASVALGAGKPDMRQLFAHEFMLVFALKFLEPELQYAGAVAFVTYAVVISGLFDLNNFDSLDWEANWIQLTGELALRRCCDVGMGVLVAAVVSIFVAPDRATDELRKREEEALRCAASVIQASARHLAWRAQGIERQESWTEMRKETWSSFEALNFAGDGLPGVADLLEDVRWESRWGVDGGMLILGGFLWLPCRSKSAPLRGRQCLEAVKELSRLLRTSHLLISVLEPGLGEDADRPLAHDSRVLEALGPEAADFNQLLDQVLSSASTSKCASLAELEERLHLLMQGCAASRQKAGGLIGPKALGGPRAAAALKLLQQCVQILAQVCKKMEGCNNSSKAESSTISHIESRTSWSLQSESGSELKDAFAV
eukprot:CAMPEP_0181501754 /NCGR_PEP_ID=MMETSP1110-20121109/55967_1 /TAXON_ID=174948 /ORGANISM="Symbiodinium sp., Strain CCMP421" /LENGTH=884 /DNA_ID=CAMNT_0023630241 /DNA_START=99 /DNA_END=2753 /DNA_ORIENTATION=-